MFSVQKFGAYLSGLRKSADMTQSDLADKIGLTRQAISKYENGDSFPDITILSQLAEVFGVSLDTLFGGGEATEGEKQLLKLGQDSQSAGGTIQELVNIAPLLRPSTLDKVTQGLAGHGIDISDLVALAKYMNSESVDRLLSSATFEKLDEEMLAHFIPFLGEESKAVVFQKILDGELDYRLLHTFLPYAEYLIQHIEAAVVYGVLDERALDIINEYVWRDKK
ncbi:MAG: helix-turn-helix domain-containing protein [Eubacteriales bacterium]